MDWERIVGHRRLALLRLVASLFAMLGPFREGSAPVPPRPVHLAILRRLRAAESAARRLLIVAARDLSVAVRLSRPDIERRESGKPAVKRDPAPSFRLLDPRKHFPELAVLRKKRQRGEPRITLLGVDEWRPQPRPVRIPRTLNPRRLLRRLRAVEAVLNDVPRHALRLARWRARREAQRAAGTRGDLIGPLRPGFPPGYRIERREEIHDMLLDLDALARMAEAARRAS